MLQATGHVKPLARKGTTPKAAPAVRARPKQTIYFFFWLFEVCDGEPLRSGSPFLVGSINSHLNILTYKANHSRRFLALQASPIMVHLTQMYLLPAVSACSRSVCVKREPKPGTVHISFFAMSRFTETLLLSLPLRLITLRSIFPIKKGPRCSRTKDPST